MTQDANVIFADMPATIPGYSISNPDMSFTIVINSRLKRERQLLAYHHEMKHIENGDYERHTSVDVIECFTHSEP